MPTTDEKKRSEYPSDLADLRRIPLADLPALSDDLDKALRRIVSTPLAGQVPVAAFNSSI